MKKFHPEKFFPLKKEGEKENIEEREKVISTEAGKEISEEKADKGVSKKIKIKKITRKIVRIEEIKKEKIETKENLEKKAELIISEYFLREKESQNWEEFLPVHEKNEKHHDEIGRIKMEAFSSIYPEAQRELQEEFLHLEKWQRQKEVKERLKKEKIEILGKKFELLAYSILCKFLQNTEYIAVRSSFYDDRKNGVDILLLEKGTGNVVCFLDAVADEERYKEKLSKVEKVNYEQNGGKIKYGIKIIRTENNKLKPILRNLEKIPIFVMALREEKEKVRVFLPLKEGKMIEPKEIELPKTIEKQLKEAEEKLCPSLNIITDEERKFFNKLLNEIEKQIVEILKKEKSFPGTLDSTVKERIINFAEFLVKIKKSQNLIKNP
jgi:hypothetical protein